MLILGQSTNLLFGDLSDRTNCWKRPFHSDCSDFAWSTWSMKQAEQKRIFHPELRTQMLSRRGCFLRGYPVKGKRSFQTKGKSQKNPYSPLFSKSSSQRELLDKILRVDHAGIFFNLMFVGPHFLSRWTRCNQNLWRTTCNPFSKFLWKCNRGMLNGSLITASFSLFLGNEIPRTRTLGYNDKINNRKKS